VSKFDFLKKIGILNALAVTLAGCNFNPANNVGPNVYGPPPMDLVDEYETDEVLEEDPEEETEDSEGETEGETEEETEGQTEGEDGNLINDDLEVEVNEPVLVYGPPPLEE